MCSPESDLPPKRCVHGNPVGFGTCVECRAHMESLQSGLSVSRSCIECERLAADNAALLADGARVNQENNRLRRALNRIADLPVEPRPDGTFNYSRAAIIEIAQEALK